jgi:hypothetical protein
MYYIYIRGLKMMHYFTYGKIVVYRSETVYVLADVVST